MSDTFQSASRPEITAAVSAVAGELFSRCGRHVFNITRDQFDSCLLTIAHKYLPPEAGEPDAEALLRSLRVEDLVLARACAAGDEDAWTQFMTRFREHLYEAALGIVREASKAKDLADSLYGDLYGTQEREGRRMSKLAMYMGRGSLEGWLRTVLAQEYVNRYRSQRRLVSLEEEEEAGSHFAAPEQTPVPA